MSKNSGTPGRSRRADALSILLLGAVFIAAFFGDAVVRITSWPRSPLVVVLPFCAYLLSLLFRFRSHVEDAQPSAGLRILWFLNMGILVILTIMPIFLNPLTGVGTRAPGGRWWLNIGVAAIAAQIEVVIQMRRRRMPLRTTSLFLCFGVLPLYFLYVGNGATITCGDNLATRVFPEMLLTHGSLDLSSRPEYSGEAMHYSGIRIGDRVLPSFPLGTGLLSVPYHVISMAAPHKTGFLYEDRCEKHFAALLAAASVFLLYLALRIRWGEFPAVTVAVTSGLGTMVPTVSGQALWTVSGEVFFFCLCMFLLARGKGALYGACAGMALGGAFLCRPTACLAAVLLVAIVWLELRGRAVWFVLMTSLTIGLCAAGLFVIYGHPFGGYGLINQGVWASHPLHPLLANLLSPNRGMLVFFPYLAFLSWWPQTQDAGARRLRTASLFLILGTLVMVSVHQIWWAGSSFGPRFLSEQTPFMALVTLPFWLVWRASSIRCWIGVLLIAFSGLTQVLAAYRPQVLAWKWSPDTMVANPGVIWRFGDSQLAAAWDLPDMAPDVAFGPPRLWIEGSAEKWCRVPLESVSSARYDGTPVLAGLFRRHVLFPRVRPNILNEPAALFHFAPLGKPNMVELGFGEASPLFPIGPGKWKFVHALMSIECSQPREKSPILAYWSVRYQNRTFEKLPLSLNFDVFDPGSIPVPIPCPEGSVYLGRPGDGDILVAGSWKLERPDVKMISLQLVRSRRLRPVQLRLLALTLQR